MFTHFNSFCMAIAIAGGLAFTSCSSADEPYIDPSETTSANIPSDCLTRFADDHPDAEDASWSTEGNYYAVSFKQEGKVIKLWYKIEDCFNTIYNSALAADDLPQAVADAFRASQFADWDIIGYGMISRDFHGETVKLYTVVISKVFGSKTVTLTVFFTEDGHITDVKEDSHTINPDEWMPDTWPQSILDYIDANHPGARCLNIHRTPNTGSYEVKIVYDRASYSLTFGADGVWASTARTLRYSQIPDDVHALINASEYAGAKITSAEVLSSPEREYYRITVRNNRGSKLVLIVENGTVSLEKCESTSDPSDPGIVNPDVIAADGLTAYVEARYPGAVVTEVKAEKKSAEVEARYNGGELEVEFKATTGGYLWQESELEYNVRDAASLPAAITTFLTERYPTYTLASLTLQEKAGEASSYVACIKSKDAHSTLKVKFDADCNFVGEYQQH